MSKGCRLTPTNKTFLLFRDSPQAFVNFNPTGNVGPSIHFFLAFENNFDFWYNF